MIWSDKRSQADVALKNLARWGAFQYVKKKKKKKKEKKTSAGSKENCFNSWFNRAVNWCVWLSQNKCHVILWVKEGWRKRKDHFLHTRPYMPPPSLYDTKICQDDDILTRSLSPDYYAISFWQISSYSTSPTNSHNLNTLPPFFSFLCSGRRRNTTNTHMQTLTHTQETFSMVDTNSLLSFFFLFLADAIVRYCLIFFYFYIHIDLLPIFIINLITVIENPLVFTISLYPLLLHSIFS